jgi:hemerythrin-like domain-containing protein
MKRSEALTPLSHDHHKGLFVAMQLKRAVDAQAAQAFLDFIDGHGGVHFRVEEDLLLPGWIAADAKADVEMARRVLAEHLAFRASARRLRSRQCTVEELHELGAALDRHIRFEERELFPRIERSLSAETMTALAAEIDQAEERG